MFINRSTKSIQKCKIWSDFLSLFFSILTRSCLFKFFYCGLNTYTKFQGSTPMYGRHWKHSYIYNSQLKTTYFFPNISLTTETRIYNQKPFNQPEVGKHQYFTHPKHGCCSCPIWGVCPQEVCPAITRVYDLLIPTLPITPHLVNTDSYPLIKMLSVDLSVDDMFGSQASCWLSQSTGNISGLLNYIFTH